MGDTFRRKAFCGALLKGDAVRVIVLLVTLAAIPACSRYDPGPPDGIITCHTGQPAGAERKGCLYPPRN